MRRRNKNGGRVMPVATKLTGWLIAQSVTLKSYMYRPLTEISSLFCRIRSVAVDEKKK
jgi:hypothetical protein